MSEKYKIPEPNEEVKGDGFVMKNSLRSRHDYNYNRVEFRPGESTDKVENRRIIEKLTGAFIQWINSGQEMFSEPHRVVKVSDDAKFVFVDGTMTGIPVEEIEIVE
jgi:hypothetical protein